MSWAGHFWTIAPHLGRRWSLGSEGRSEAWAWTILDPRFGTVRIHGRLDPMPSSSELLIVVHGLGGSSQSGYVCAAAASALAARMACLRLDMRGADLRGEDYYHAGLWQDLDLVLRDPRLERYDALYLLGYSIGGHVSLCWAARPEARTSRVRAVAAVCAPLDLSPTAAAFDAPSWSVYRTHVLGGLKRMYRAVASRRQVPLSVTEAERIHRLREWDEQVVAPRHGFRSAEHYYAEASVAELLTKVAHPTLLVIAEHDPMVPLGTLEPALARVPKTTTVKRLRHGGHLGFPADTSLGMSPPLGLEPQLLSWLRSHERA